MSTLRHWYGVSVILASLKTSIQETKISVIRKLPRDKKKSRFRGSEVWWYCHHSHGDSHASLQDSRLNRVGRTIASQTATQMNLSRHLSTNLAFIGCSAGLRTGQTGQLPRGLHKKGPPQKHIFFLKYGCIVQCMS